MRIHYNNILLLRRKDNNQKLLIENGFLQSSSSRQNPCQLKIHGTTTIIRIMCRVACETQNKKSQAFDVLCKVYNNFHLLV